MDVPVAQSRLSEGTDRSGVVGRLNVERAFGLFLVFFAVALLPVGLSLKTIGADRPIQSPSTHDLPYGYTISLVMFAAPLATLGIWARRRVSRAERRAALAATGTMILLGFFLEWSLGASCFNFPNPRATIGLTLPVLYGASPIEEFLFFALGPPAILLAYLWADKDWMSAYHVEVAGLSGRRPVIVVNLGLAVAAAVALGVIVLVRSAAGIPGIPLYFLYLFAIPTITSVLLIQRAGRVVNWRALSLITAVLMLVSIVWEANLGVPYGWWGYRNSAMLGIFIGPWSGLPVEEPFLWFVTAFTVVVWYEAARLWFAQESREAAG